MIIRLVHSAEALQRQASLSSPIHGPDERGSLTEAQTVAADAKTTTDEPCSVTGPQAGKTDFSLVRSGAVVGLSLKLYNAGLGFLTSIALTRLLGLDDFGVFAFAQACVLTLISPCTLGLNRFLVREVASNCAHSYWSMLRGLQRWSLSVVLALSLVIGGVAAAIALLSYPAMGSLTALSVAIAMFFLPASALAATSQSILQGARRLILAAIPQLFIQPTLFIVLICGALLSGTQASPIIVLLLYGGTVYVALAFSLTFLKRAHSSQMKSEPPTYHSSRWFAACMPLFVLQFAFSARANATTLLLGALGTSADTGLYAIAFKLTVFITFGLIAVNSAIGSTVSRLHATGKRDVLQQLVSKFSGLVFLFGLACAVPLIVVPEFFLSFFGEEFLAASTALRLLACAQLVSAFAGSVGLILIMTKHENDVLVVTAITVVLNVALNAALIPIAGLYGAVCTHAACIVFWNVTLLYRVWRRLRINPTPIALLRFKQ